MLSCAWLVLALGCALSIAVGIKAPGGPMSKVFSMLADLQAKLTKEGTDAQKVFDEFSDWCQDRSKNIELEVKHGQASVAELSAAIEKASAKITASNTKIEELSASIASDEADLKAATEIRTSEASDFAAEEKELVAVQGTLQRAIAVLNRELAKGGGSMIQLQNAKDMTQALDAMVHASVLSSADVDRLTSLAQSDQSSQDGDGEAASSTPGAAVDKKSVSVVETLEDLLDKAEAQMEKARKTEAASAQNYAMLKSSLQNEIRAGAKDMDETKQRLASAKEAKGSAEGGLATTQADLKEDLTMSAGLKQDCTTGAEDFQAEVKRRGQELKALAEAQKVLADALPAAAHTYGAALEQAMFLQESKHSQHSSRPDLMQFKAVRSIRDLARKQNSVELAQLASQISSIIRYGTASGSNPVAKVKSIITDLIAKLEQDAKADLSHKGFCDKEMTETKLKKDEKMYQINKLSTQIDSMTAKSAKLKQEAATLQGEIAELLSSQSEMDKIRSEEKGLYAKGRSEMDAGIRGVLKASSVLKDYYGQNGAGSSKRIIELLEVVQSDFTAGLAEMEVAESTAVKEYERTTYTSKTARKTKERELTLKTKESASLDKSGAESGSDKDGVQTELDALIEYTTKLNKMCSGQAEPYAQRKARRDAEIAGLNQALTALESDGALLQSQATKTSFRGRRAQV